MYFCFTFVCLLFVAKGGCQGLLRNLRKSDCFRWLYCKKMLYRQDLWLKDINNFHCILVMHSFQRHNSLQTCQLVLLGYRRLQWDFFYSCQFIKVFGHSIHSESWRIYLGKSIQALRNDTIIIIWLFSSRAIQPTLKLRLFLSVLVYYRKFSRQSVIKATIRVFNTIRICHIWYNF